jgi:hypothetical protein
MKLSRSPPPSAAGAPLKALSEPSAARSTASTGCTTSRTSTPRSDNSPSTESTRNGISSLTISSTELALSRSWAPLGDARRTFGVPGLRSAKSAQASAASAATSRGS